MKITYISQTFQPEPNPRGLSFAQELGRLGHQVRVVTGIPNYPGGKIYKGYKLVPVKQERVVDVDITRLILFPSHNSNTWARIINYLSFAVSSSTLGMSYFLNSDLNYVFHPTVTAAIPALLSKIIKGTPYILDIQDLWPESLTSTGMITDSWLIKGLNFWLGKIYANSSKIIVISPGFKKALMNRGVPGDKIEVIYNWCEEGYFYEQESKVPDRKRVLYSKLVEQNSCYKFIYAGNLGKAQDVDLLLRAFGELAYESFPVKLYIIGDGTEKDNLKEAIRRENIANVELFDRIPPGEIAGYLKLADALIVSLKKDPLFEITVPSKTQSYMALGKPILLIGAGDVANLIKEAGCGLVCNPGNRQGIKESIIKFIGLSKGARDGMGISSYTYYKNEISMKKGMCKYERVLEEIGKKA